VPVLLRQPIGGDPALSAAGLAGSVLALALFEPVNFTDNPVLTVLLNFLSTPLWFNLGRFLVMAGAAAYFIGFPFKRG